MTARGLLRPDLERRQIQLDKLPPKTVVIDERGDVWQKGSADWYRAFDAESETSFVAAQVMERVTILDGTLP